MDEEMYEQIQLEGVLKEYDKLYKKACRIHVKEDDSPNENMIVSSSPYSLGKGKSWNEILEKIDKLHVRAGHKTKE